MISRIWDLRITVLDATCKQTLGERRIRHNLPLEQADVVALYSYNRYSAVVRQKIIEDKGGPIIVRVPVKGLTGLPGLQKDFTSYEDDDNDDSNAESSDSFWKTWTTYEEQRKEQECMSIQKELYRSLVIAFKGKKGLPFPDTSDLVCPFCEQEFVFQEHEATL